nr:MAG TPA: hypothetical protein [Caudoviricetes sp.]
MTDRATEPLDPARGRWLFLFNSIFNQSREPLSRCRASGLGSNCLNLLG